MPYLTKTIATLMLLITACIAVAQEDQPDYLRYPSLPKFKILTPDSTLYTCDGNTKSKKTIILVFSTDCHFCKQEIDSLTAHMDQLREVRIVMATFDPLEAVRNFSKTYNLDKYPNVIIGRDLYYFFIPFYGVTQVPFTALYSERGKLVKTFRSTASINTLTAAFSEHKE